MDPGGTVGATCPPVRRATVDAFAVIRHDRQKMRESSHTWNPCRISLPVTKTVVGLNHVVPNPDCHRIWGEIVEALLGRDGEPDLVSASVQHAEHAAYLLDVCNRDVAHLYSGRCFRIFGPYQSNRSMERLAVVAVQEGRVWPLVSTLSRKSFCTIAGSVPVNRETSFM